MFRIQHDATSNQFITQVEGKIAFLRYHALAGREVLEYYSTFVPPDLRGHHIGQELVKFALEYAKERQLQIIPTCSFVRHFIDEHPDYEELVYHEVP